MIKALLCTFVFVLLIPAGWTSDTTPSPEQLLAKGTEATDIWTHDPLQISGKVRFLRMKNQPLDMEYILYWAGSSEWRFEWHGGGISDIHAVANGISWAKTNLPTPSVRILQFNEAMRRLIPTTIWPSPFGAPTPLNATQKYTTKGRKNKGKLVFCIESDSPLGKCFASDDGTPVSESTNLANVTYSDYVNFAGKRFPGVVTVYEGDAAVLEAKIEIKPWQSDSAVFLPASGSIETALSKCTGSGSITYGRNIQASAPQYPSNARVNGQQGKVIVYAYLGIDGRIKNLLTLQSAGPTLDNATFDAVRQWKYEPSLYCGEPVEVEFPIAVNYKISAINGL